MQPTLSNDISARFQRAQQLGFAYGALCIENPSIMPGVNLHDAAVILKIAGSIRRKGDENDSFVVLNQSFTRGGIVKVFAPQVFESVRQLLTQRSLFDIPKPQDVMIFADCGYFGGGQCPTERITTSDTDLLRYISDDRKNQYSSGRSLHVMLTWAAALQKFPLPINTFVAPHSFGAAIESLAKSSLSQTELEEAGMHVAKSFLQFSRQGMKWKASQDALGRREYRVDGGIDFERLMTDFGIHPCDYPFFKLGRGATGQSYDRFCQLTKDNLDQCGFARGLDFKYTGTDEGKRIAAIVKKAYEEEFPGVSLQKLMFY